MSCPSYDDLIWFADTGERDQLNGHKPEDCPRCSKLLEQYEGIRTAARKLRGILPDADVELEPHMTLPEIPENVKEVQEMNAEARRHFHVDWSAARVAAEIAEARARALHISSRFEKHTAEVARAETEETLGVCLFRTGDPSGAMTYLHRALGRWRQLDEPVGIGKTLINMALVANYQGKQDDAEAWAKEAQVMLDAVGQDSDAAKAWVILGIVFGDRGKYAEAVIEYQSAARIFRRLGDHHDLAICLQNEGMAYLALTRNDEAIASANAAEKLFTKLGHQTEAARCTWLYGRAQLAAGELDSGLKTLEAAQAVFLTGGLWIEASLIACAEAEAELGTGRDKTARARLEALCERIPADQQNDWVKSAVDKLRSALNQPEATPLSAALRELTSRLQAAPPPSEANSGSTIH